MTAPRGRPHTRLFRKYVLIFVTLVSGALLSSGLIEGYFSYQEHKTALFRIQRERALTAAAKIEQFISEIERQVTWIAQAPWGLGPDELAQRRLDTLRLLRQAPAITEVSYLDAAGKEQLHVSRLAVDVLGSQRDLSQEPAFLNAAAGRPYFGPVYFRRESEPYMTVAMAGRGPAAGVTVAEVNLKFIWDVVSRIGLGKGEAYAVDSRGILIAHPDISLVLKKTDLSSLPQVRAARAGAAGAGAEREEVTVAPNLRGVQVLAASAEIAPLGWVILVEQPLGEAFAPLYASLARTGALMATGLLLAVLVGFVLARKMVTPIQALQAGAMRIGAGDLAHRIEITRADELGALAREFNQMAARLRESYANLEEKVERRTQELTQALNELTALGDVGRAVSSTLDLETVLGRIVSHAVELTAADSGAIYEYDDAAEAFHLRATYQMEDELVAMLRAMPIRLGVSAIGRAALAREPVQIPDIFEEKGYEEGLRSLLGQYGLRALLAVPLFREDQIIGGLVMRRKAPGEFPRKVVDLLQTFAAQSALAIQNARLFREIEEKRRELELASKHKSQFLANMSHELRTPLNAVLGYTELILDNIYGEVPEKIRDVLERVQKSGVHLLSLINDVLDLSKIEAGQLTLALNEYSMREVVHAVVTAMEPLAAEKKLALKVTVPPDLPAGRGDERRLAQVLLNLVGNAVKFTETGEVRVEVTASDGAFAVSVSDTGPGIPEADQERIFEEFHQVDSSNTRKKGGTGLGLAIAKRIIELHGGRIGVTSRLGQGSTFWFTVPVRVDRQVGTP